MILNIAKWKDNAVSPVIFMVDDIANVSVKNSKREKLEIGEDWGQYGRDNNSMWDFLSKNLLEKFPHIQTTLFLVTDKRVPMALGETYNYNEPMDRNKKFINFLQYLSSQPNVELAYHGTTHGKASIKHKDFLQEWETFKTLDMATSEINRGKELFKKVLSAYPTGGKYCGYEAGKFGDDSISKTGFKWWCYHWDGVIWDRGIKNSKYNYDLEINQGVVDIPSTVDASTLSLKIVKKFFTRKYLKSLYLYLKKGKTIERHIASLYNNGEVISIQEHTSPYRTDGRIQYPNIVSDIDNLNYIFSFLNKKEIWYTTCNALADYYLTRLNVTIQIKKNNTFQLSTKRNVAKELLTLVTPFMGEERSLCDEEGKFLSIFKHKRDELYITYPFKIGKIYKLI